MRAVCSHGIGTHDRWATGHAADGPRSRANRGVGRDSRPSTGSSSQGPDRTNLASHHGIVRGQPRTAKEARRDPCGRPSMDQPGTTCVPEATLRPSVRVPGPEQPRACAVYGGYCGLLFLSTVSLLLWSWTPQPSTAVSLEEAAQRLLLLCSAAAAAPAADGRRPELAGGGGAAPSRARHPAFFHP